MSSIRMPNFVTELVEDLRERRLLIPAIVLVVALVAIPFLLSSSTEAPPPPPSESAIALDSAAEVQPAVLAESVSVRDYTKRLNDLKKKNPFQSPTAPFEAAAEALEGLDDLVPPTGQPVGGAGFGTDALGGGADTGTSSSSSSSSSPVTSSPSSSTSGGGGGGGSTEVRYFTREIDVKVGQVGQLQSKKGIGQLTMLPSESKPVLVFLGTNDDGKKGVFLVSDDVASTAGDGACIPDPSDCEYLTMREGDSRTFSYTPDGNTYKLVLKEIRDVALSKAPEVEP